MSDQSDVPFHMQYDSEDTLASDSGGEQSKPGENAAPATKPKGKSKQGGFFGRGAAQVGKIELDPRINYANFSKSGPGLDSKATVDEDGKINVWVNLKQTLPQMPDDYAISVEEDDVDPERPFDCPPMNIVIFIVGSRGDVQPYLSLALHLIQSNGHRVRIATHPDFREFILDGNKRLAGKKANDGSPLEGKLEFFDAGGDPKALMAYMVKNPGLMPGWESLKSGDIAANRKMTGEMLDGFYNSVFTPDPVSGKAFAADAIISNPPAFAHIHIAEALGIPLHMSFTMPWTPTTAFPHPLVNIKSTNAEANLTNYLTYGLADMLTWQGLGDVINAFRTATLGLDPLNARVAASILDRSKVPWTYCWTEGLIPKPADWKSHIDISGFYFLPAEIDFKPDAALQAFLDAGKPPIYVGFGSIVVEDAEALTQTIFDAVKQAGVRAIVSAGWGGLGGTTVPDEIFVQKGNIPHDWLFADGKVTAVCHHGGAGTAAIGLRNGLPTVVVPFFGDQKFWGDMIHRAGAGPQPIPKIELSVDNLAKAIEFAVSPQAKTAAAKMGEEIRRESGEEKGVNSFHAHLPLKAMRCDIDPTRVASFYSPDLVLRLSGTAAAVLDQAGKLKMEKLETVRTKEYNLRWKASNPLSGGAAGLLLLLQKHYGGLAQMFYKPSTGIVNYSTAIPQGLADVIINMHDGFDAIPRRMGSEMRERGEVTDFASGVKEGGKGLFYGWWDGITGLAVEPISGAKKEGVAGFVKGAGRSWVNVTARPAAGVLGVMALPLRGTWLSLRKKIAGAPQKALRQPREQLAKLDAEQLGPEEKKRILEKYDELLKTTNERREALKTRTRLFLTRLEEQEKTSKEANVEEAQ